MNPLTQSERFWSNVDKVAGPNACWPWLAGTNDHGYGLFFRGKGISRLAHRFALELSSGCAPPRGLFVLHSCDNPPCCNPQHLRTGTHRDNVTDMVERGRSANMRNERSGTAILTDAQVGEIRASWLAGATQAELGRQYGVSAWHVSQIVRVTRRPIEGPVRASEPTPWAVRRERDSQATAELWAEASRLYETGMTMDQIAAQLDCNPATVSRRLRQSGVVTRGKADYYRQVDPVSIKRLHADGVRVGRMVAILGIGRARIEKVMDELDLPRFPTGIKSDSRRPA